APQALTPAAEPVVPTAAALEPVAFTPGMSRAAIQSALTPAIPLRAPTPSQMGVLLELADSASAVDQLLDETPTPAPVHSQTAPAESPPRVVTAHPSDLP